MSNMKVVGEVVLTNGEKHTFELDFGEGVALVDDKVIQKNRQNRYSFLKIGIRTYKVYFNEEEEGSREVDPQQKVFFETIWVAVEPQGNFSLGKIIEFFYDLVEHIDYRKVLRKYGVKTFIGMVGSLVGQMEEIDFAKLKDIIETESFLYVEPDEFEEVSERFNLRKGLEENGVVTYYLLHEIYGVEEYNSESLRRFLKEFFNNSPYSYIFFLNDKFLGEIAREYLKAYYEELIKKLDEIAENKIKYEVSLETYQKYLDKLEKISSDKSVLIFFVEYLGRDQFMEFISELYEEYGDLILDLDSYHLTENVTWVTIPAKNRRKGLVIVLNYSKL